MCLYGKRTKVGLERDKKKSACVCVFYVGLVVVAGKHFCLLLFWLLVFDHMVTIVLCTFNN